MPSWSTVRLTRGLACFPCSPGTPLQVLLDAASAADTDLPPSQPLVFNSPGATVSKLTGPKPPGPPPGLAAQRPSLGGSGGSIPSATRGMSQEELDSDLALAFAIAEVNPARDDEDSTA